MHLCDDQHERSEEDGLFAAEDIVEARKKSGHDVGVDQQRQKCRKEHQHPEHNRKPFCSSEFQELHEKFCRKQHGKQKQIGLINDIFVNDRFPEAEIKNNQTDKKQSGQCK